jgi:hypothetical protein
LANIFGYVTSSSTNPGVWEVSGVLQLAADGYTAVAPFPREFGSLVHTGTGSYSLFLAHCWASLLNVDISVISSTFSAVQLVSHNIGASNTVDGAQGVVFKTLNSSGTATDVAANGQITFSFLLKNTDVP